MHPDDERTPEVLHPTPRDVAVTAAVVLTAVVVAAFGTAAIVDNTNSTTVVRPVVEITTDELEAWTAQLRRIADDPQATREERRIAEQGAEVVAAIENGEVVVVPSALRQTPPTAPTATSVAPQASTPPPSTWPAASDAAPLLPPVLPPPALSLPGNDD